LNKAEKGGEFETLPTVWKPKGKDRYVSVNRSGVFNNSGKQSSLELHSREARVFKHNFRQSVTKCKDSSPLAPLKEVLIDEKSGKPPTEIINEVGEKLSDFRLIKPPMFEVKRHL
jgi:hypothetical protein